MKADRSTLMRRPHIYPHRSMRMLPLVKRRFAGGLVASACLTGAVWYWLIPIVTFHNAVAYELAELAGIRDVQVVETVGFGRIVPVILTLATTGSAWVPYVAALAFAVALIVLAIYAPLSRGLTAFMLTMLVASGIGHFLRVSALTRPDTFPVVWTHSEMLVWLVLPSMSALLFVTAQPSWVRGLLWMLGVQAFAVLWSAARLVVVLGIAQHFGAVVLPTIWFAWGLLADVVYVTTFFSMAVHVNVRLTPERRTAWAS